MIKLVKITVGTVVVLLMGLMMSCNNLNENEFGLDNEGTGTVVFKITDAPFPVDMVKEANVTIDWIKLLKYPAEDVEGDATDEEEVILIELAEPETYNLLDLRNGLTATMAEMEIPVGAYAEIRLHVTDAGIVLHDETSHNLKVPGGDASGIKIKLEPALDVLEGVQTEVLVDFDLSRSFVMRGNEKNNNGFIFKPVVRAVGNVETETGIIEGMVTYADETPVTGAFIKLLEADTVKITAITETDGFYLISGVLPGMHALVMEIVENDVVTVSDTVEVIVAAGETTVENFEVEDPNEVDGTGSGTESEGTGEPSGE